MNMEEQACNPAGKFQREKQMQTIGQLSWKMS